MFEVLYSFQSPEWEIFEVKRTDLGEEAPKSEVYHWFKVERSKRRLERLSFKAMESSGQVQRRLFDGHELSFNQSKAILSQGQEMDELRVVEGIGSETRDLVSRMFS